MKLGQTSIVHFSSQLTGTVVGFLVTLFLARELGSEILGIYFLVIALVSWLEMPSTVGIRSAISKRLSEGENQGAYLIAGATAIGGLAIVTVTLVWTLRSVVNAYVGRPVAEFVVLLVLAGAGTSLLKAVLIGQRRVHVVGLLTPIQTISRGILQVSLVLLGLQITGLLIGHFFGTMISIGAALLAVSIVVARPEREHFARLLSFAKYSWLGQIRGKTFNRMDILVLGIFVQANLIGIYSISWNVASVLGIFAASMSTTLFPELSKLSSEERTEDIRDLFEMALAYAGLLHIPGFVGVVVLGPRILRIYGPEFVSGAAVLTILVLAYLINSYNHQILTTLDSVDRPDLAFRANAGLIASNLVLNIGLVYWFGWIGAAVATALSVALGFGIGLWHVRRIIDFALPIGMVAKQVAAAGVMGLIVFGGLWVEETHAVLSNNVATVLILVVLGATVYFSALLSISPVFRKTVRQNLPSLVFG